MHAANAAAETAEMPMVVIDEPAKSRSHTGLLVAAGIMMVSAGALAVGVFSTRSNTVEVVAQPAAAVTESTDSVDVASLPAISGSGRTGVSSEAVAAGEEALTARLHDQVAESLPRIQAANEGRMSEGSGLFVTGEGHVATSAGLIDGAEYVLVWTADGGRWRAKVIAMDFHSDIAVVQIQSQDWPAIALGSGANLRSGQYALAIDHDYDEITIGEVVSDNGFRVEVEQTAAVPGSAIVDDTGAVIAMVTNDGSNRTATPAWMIEQVAVDLITSGTTSHTYLGVTLESLPDEQITVVREVLPGSPAEQAGLQVDDIIDSVNGDPTSDAPSVRRAIQAALPGEDAVITVSRDGDRRIIIATLAELP